MYVGAPLGVVQGAPTTDSQGVLSSSAQRRNTPNTAPSHRTERFWRWAALVESPKADRPGTTRPPPPASKIASAYITVFTYWSTSFLLRRNLEALLRNGWGVDGRGRRVNVGGESNLLRLSLRGLPYGNHAKQVLRQTVTIQRRSAWLQSCCWIAAVVPLARNSFAMTDKEGSAN